MFFYTCGYQPSIFCKLITIFAWLNIYIYTDIYIYIYIYKNYIIHCKIKKNNHQVPKIIRVPGNKTNPKKKNKKNLQLMQLATTIQNILI